MRSITITAWRRPEYLNTMLASLAKNDLSGYRIYFGLEPGCTPVIDLADAFPHEDKIIVINQKKLGVCDNPFNVLSLAFSQGSEGNIYIEEDLALSPDVTQVADWYLDQVDKTQVLYLGLFNMTSDPSKPEQFFKGRSFSPLGGVISKDQWNTWFKPNWKNNAEPIKIWGKWGWDWCMSAVIRNNPELRSIFPKASRTNHIGREGGVHCTPEDHDKHFGHLKISSSVGVTYKLEGDENEVDMGMR